MSAISGEVKAAALDIMLRECESIGDSPIRESGTSFGDKIRSAMLRLEDIREKHGNDVFRAAVSETLGVDQAVEQ